MSTDDILALYESGAGVRDAKQIDEGNAAKVIRLMKDALAIQKAPPLPPKKNGNGKKPKADAVPEPELAVEPEPLFQSGEAAD